MLLVKPELGENDRIRNIVRLLNSCQYGGLNRELHTAKMLVELFFRMSKDNLIRKLLVVVS